MDFQHAMESEHLEKLRAIIDERGIGWVALGALAGLPPERIHDVITYDRELWHVNVAAFLRMCMALEMPPVDLLPRDAFSAGQYYADSEPHAHSAGLAHDLRELVPEMNPAAVAVGCEPAALESWLSDDYHLSQMPLFALDALCEHLSVSLVEVVNAYWRALGRSSESEE